MPARFPHRYTATLVRVGRSLASIEAPPRPPLVGSPPPEFGGPADRWSPEHLLLSALGLCLYTTFEALATKDELELLAWRSEVEGVLDRTASGLAFTSFVVRVELASSDIDRARAVLERAKRQCIVTNALCVPVAIDATFAGSA